jgi:hypothetical protein
VHAECKSVLDHLMVYRQGRKINNDDGMERSEAQTPFWSFEYLELEESRVETLHHRSLEFVKCETSKS